MVGIYLDVIMTSLNESGQKDKFGEISYASAAEINRFIRKIKMCVFILATEIYVLKALEFHHI